MGTLVLVVRVLLAAVFLVAAIGKLLDRTGSRLALRGFGVPPRVVGVVSAALPIVELAVAVALILRPSAQWGAVAAAALLLTFVGGIVNVLAQGLRPGCHCFGIFHSEPAGPRALARNGVLLALAAVGAAAGPGPSLSTWVSHRTATALVAIGLGLLAAILAIVLWQLWLTNVKLSASLAEKDAALAAMPPGLPVGAIAPEFELVDAAGSGTITLQSLLARGKPVLLTFIGIGCMPSTELLPELTRWQRALADRLTIATVSRGDAWQHDYEVHTLGMRDVGLQREFETILAYRVLGTPSAVLVAPNGRVAAPLAQSGQAIEALVRLTLRDGLPSERLPHPLIAASA